MKQLISLGIIAEYNPFHLGHAYHMEKAREMTKADLVIVIMSGNFIQRGEPALVDKYTRAQMALCNGADLVIELPVIAACSSAPYFARGSMALLNKLKVPYLCFGSESGDLSRLNRIVELLESNNPLLDLKIKESVAAGLSYPLARSRAIQSLLKETDGNPAEYDAILSMPNNILGIEYLLEIQRKHYPITPVTITRSGNHYNDSTLTGSLSSATAIRNSILKNGMIPQNAIPQSVYELLTEYSDHHYFPSIDDFSQIIFYRLLELQQKKVETEDNCIADLPEYLLNKLWKSMKHCHSATQLIETVKSKDLTYTRISRALLHLILNIKNKDYAEFMENPCRYIRVLGFNDTGASYLSTIKKTLDCPLISKTANFSEYLKADIFAADVYNMVVNSHSRTPLADDYRHKIIRL